MMMIKVKIIIIIMIMFNDNSNSLQGDRKGDFLLFRLDKQAGAEQDRTGKCDNTHVLSYGMHTQDRSDKDVKCKSSKCNGPFLKCIK